MPFEAEVGLKPYEIAELLEQFEEIDIVYDIRGGGGKAEKFSGEEGAQHFVEIFQGGGNHRIFNSTNPGDVSLLEFKFEGESGYVQFKVEPPEMELDNGKRIDFKIAGYKEGIRVDKFIIEVMKLAGNNNI